MAVKKWVAEAPGKWATAANWEGGVIPSAASDAQFVEAHNTSCEINGTALKCKSLECVAGYTGTFTSTTTAKLAIGTTTGTGTALKLTAGSKWSVDSLMIISFLSESGVVEGITTAGNAMPEVLFAGPSGSWKLLDALTFLPADGLSLKNGTLDTNGQTVTIPSSSFNIEGASTRTCKLGASTIVCAAWSAGVEPTNLTFEAGTSVIECTSKTGTSFFTGGGLTYHTVLLTSHPVTQANAFATLGINSKGQAAGKGVKLEVGKTQTVTLLSCNGTEAEPARLESSKAAEAGTIKLPADQELTAYLIVKDTTISGGVLYLPHGTDGGGNTNIRFEAKPGEATASLAMMV